jgi:hypothetical protein
MPEPIICPVCKSIHTEIVREDFSIHKYLCLVCLLIWYRMNNGQIFYAPISEPEQKPYQSNGDDFIPYGRDEPQMGS